MEEETMQGSQYLGAKLVRAYPMNEYVFLQEVGKEWGSTPDREGYKIIYKNAESWSSKTVFEEAYRQVNGLSFGLALEALHKGLKVTRIGWNNPTILVKLQVPDEHSKMTKPYIYMIEGEEKFPFNLSCESIMADDWKIV